MHDIYLYQGCLNLLHTGTHRLLRPSFQEHGKDYMEEDKDIDNLGINLFIKTLMTDIGCKCSSQCMDKQIGGKIYHIIRFQQFPPPQRQQIQHTHRQALTNIQPATTNTTLPQRPQQAQQGQGNNSRDYNALLRNRPCWVCDRTGHLIRECPKKKPKGCPRCGQDHSIFHCLNRKQTVRYITVEEVQEEGSGT